MRLDELADKLAEMYQNAKGDKAAMIHLFGIKYADVIRRSGYNAGDIIISARLTDGTRIPDSYKTEINKGMNLAKYVIDKESLINFVKR